MEVNNGSTGGRQRIQDGAEWAMLDGLHRQMHRLVAVQRTIYDTGQKPKHKKKQLQDFNQWRGLNLEMRQALSRPDLKVLLDLDSESGSSTSPSFQKVNSLLKDVCSCLEKLVNTALISPSTNRKSTWSRLEPYPNLYMLIDHLEFSEGPNEGFELMAILPSASALFISPNKDLKRAKKIMVEFNQFIQTLQISDSSLHDLSKPLPDKPPPPSVISYNYKGFGSTFRRQAMKTFRAIFSNITKCGPQQKVTHQVLLRLPHWEEVILWDAPKIQQELQMFLTGCTTPFWQKTRVQIAAPEIIGKGWDPPLCKAIKFAQENNISLELQVHSITQPGGDEDVVLRVASTKSYETESKCHPEKLLQNLIDDGVLNKTLTPSQRQKLRNIQPFNFGHRKSLAIKLIFGLLMSLESGYAIRTWDSRHIRFISTADGNGELRDVPYVQCDVADEAGRNLLALPGLDMLKEGPPSPFPIFTLLAKILLEVAAGDCSTLGMTSPYEINHRESNKLLEIINLCLTHDFSIENLGLLTAAQSCARFHVLYWNEAFKLWSNPRNKQLINGLEIAQRLIYDEILRKIDDNLPLPDFASRIDVDIDILRNDSETSKLSARSNGQQVNECDPVRDSDNKSITENGHGSTDHVVLFDEEVSSDPQSSHAKRAKDFFERLDKFQKSCETLPLASQANHGRVKIAIIDTGIDMTNSAIQAICALNPSPINTERCRSWVGDENDIHDNVGHGTSCAYLAHKAAPNADIYVAKVFSDKHFKLYQAQNVADAIAWASDVWKVDIISLSFGLRPPRYPQQRDEWVKIHTAIRDSIDKAGDRIVFAAASNGGLNEPRAFPANYRNTICIHASDGNGNEGGINPEPNVGEDFMTLGMAVKLLQDSQYVYKSGTSYATPIAAGIAASVLGIAQRTTNLSDSTKDYLRRCAGMRIMFQIMSTDKLGYRYVAPWCHWTESWTVTKPDSVWERIENKFHGLD